MPRANRHILAGYSYHITHRCHDRAFLLRFGRDRQAYRSWLIRGLGRHDVSLLTYCITSNHVHLLIRANSPDDLASFMQYVQGHFARTYNGRKIRKGAFWNDRYHATMIEDGDHLWRCMRYIDLNMVRAGVVDHPGQWEWTGWKELMGLRRRNRLLDMDAILDALSMHSVEEFRTNYRVGIETTLAGRLSVRESFWSEAVAVGSETFVAGIEQQLRSDYTRKTTSADFECIETWALRETDDIRYGRENAPENRAIGV